MICDMCLKSLDNWLSNRISYCRKLWIGYFVSVLFFFWKNSVLFLVLVNLNNYRTSLWNCIISDFYSSQFSFLLNFPYSQILGAIAVKDWWNYIELNYQRILWMIGVTPVSSKCCASHLGILFELPCNLNFLWPILNFWLVLLSHEKKQQGTDLAVN